MKMHVIRAGDPIRTEGAYKQKESRRFVENSRRIFVLLRNGTEANIPGNSDTCIHISCSYSSYLHIDSRYMPGPIKWIVRIAICFPKSLQLRLNAK
jgi:hypothetical protein